jgi:hypothetical protein
MLALLVPPAILAESALGITTTPPGQECGTVLATQAAWNASRGESRARKRLCALRTTADAPRIDGRLDDAAWRAALFAHDFTQRDPVEGAPAPERTEVAVLYDNDALYIAARLHTNRPGQFASQLTRRDASGSADLLLVSLDPYLDRRTAYSFGVTAAGVRLDFHHPSDDATNRDYSFDPVWHARVHRNHVDWTAEMRIPFSQLRFNAQDVQTWGINISRSNPSQNYDVYWVLVPKTETGWASRFGDLIGLNGIDPRRRLELLPYVAASARAIGTTQPANPFVDGADLTSRTGVDARVGFGPNLTLEATFNPDFGQVEADPAEVNLTAFETVFTEKRPFFAEGSSLLRATPAPYFYSRRLGASPLLSPAGDFVDRPSNTTILGAAKLTGRLPTGLAIAALGALTAPEYASTFDTASAEFDRVRVAPTAAHGIVRLQQQWGRDASTIGLILTGVQRDLDAGSELARLQTDHAITGGVDGMLRFRGGQYVLRADLGFSHAAGEEAAILRLQRSSARYYQRPDARYAVVDSTRTSLSGYRAQIGFERRAGRHWLWDVATSVESPGLELNDLGQQSTADDVYASGTLRYRETRPAHFYRNYQISTYANTFWNYEGARERILQGVNVDLTLKNFWNLALHYHIETRGLSSSLTRGGPLMGTPFFWDAFARLSNRPGAHLNWNGYFLYEADEQGRNGVVVRAGLTYRFHDRWSVSLDPSWSHSTDPRQYVTTRAGGSQLTFGRRYIFAAIERSTLSARFRLNYTLTPEISIESYAEPFASSGRYSDFGELAGARSRHLHMYGSEGSAVQRLDNGSRVVVDQNEQFTLPNLDFNVRSLRSNIVLRWEWRAGSTLFLVWQQDRSSRETHGRLVSMGSPFESLRAPADHNFAVKLSYWLPI